MEAGFGAEDGPLHAAASSGREPESPCIRQCSLLETVDRRSGQEARLCRSCGRTIDEIRSWKSMSARQKERCIDAAHGRRLELGAAGGVQA